MVVVRKKLRRLSNVGRNSYLIKIEKRPPAKVAPLTDLPAQVDDISTLHIWVTCSTGSTWSSNSLTSPLEAIYRSDAQKLTFNRRYLAQSKLVYFATLTEGGFLQLNKKTH